MTRGATCRSSFVANLGNIVNTSLFIWGASYLHGSLGVAFQCAAAALIVIMTINLLMTIYDGPDSVNRHPLAFAATWLPFTCLYTFLHIIPCFLRQKDVPFQSRAAHLVLVTVGMLFSCIQCSSGSFPWERSVRTAHVWRFMWHAFMRGLETCDAVSDLAYASLLYEQVSLPLCCNAC